MKTTAKNIERSNIIFAFAEGSLGLPDPANVFALYPGTQSRGALFSDNTALASRIFEFPEMGYQLVFEPTRIRIEDRKRRTPDESKLGQEMVRILGVLYPNAVPVAHGFNYDILYRTSTVIPVQEIMGAFLNQTTIENVKDFGWQYTVALEKGKRTQMYFFKAVSPIELSIHANFHFNQTFVPRPAVLQESFERAYGEADDSLDHMKY